MTTKEDARKRHVKELAHALREAMLAGIRADYDLGRWLDRIIEDRAWSDPAWPDCPENGYPDSTGGFNDWCWHVLGFRSRKAYYHRNNYLRLAKLNVEHEDKMLFDRALELGWTKLDHVLGVSHSLSDLKHWINRVEKENLTENQLKVEVRLARGDGEPPQEPSSSTDNAAAALEADPATHAGGQVPEGAAYVGNDGMALMDSEGVQLDAETGQPLSNQDAAPSTKVKFPLIFRDQDAARMFVRATDLIRRRTGTEGNGECAAMMAASYLATTPHEDEGGLAEELENIISIVEDTWGVKLYTPGQVGQLLLVGGVPRDKIPSDFVTATVAPAPEPAPVDDAAMAGFTA